MLVNLSSVCPSIIVAMAASVEPTSSTSLAVLWYCASLACSAFKSVFSAADQIGPFRQFFEFLLDLAGNPRRCRSRSFRNSLALTPLLAQET